MLLSRHQLLCHELPAGNCLASSLRDLWVLNEGWVGSRLPWFRLLCGLLLWSRLLCGRLLCSDEPMQWVRAGRCEPG